MSIGLLLVSWFTLVELNCENLFDTQHDTLRQDTEFLPEGSHHWTRTRYWRKLNRVGQTILACGGVGDDWQLPDLVALTEVENDTVLRDLTRRSLLRQARYEYVMTDSPDERGIDVALLYSPFSFAPVTHRSIRAPLLDDMKPTRDVLYVAGRTMGGDTLHVLVVHAPSRSGGERATRAFRMQVARCVAQTADSIRAVAPDARIVVTGDFNAYRGEACLAFLEERGLRDVTATAEGTHGAKGTYKYHGLWASLDHTLCSAAMEQRVPEAFVMDAPFLLEDDEKYGGVQPRRNYLGPRYLNGFSDHLPLVVRFRFNVSSIKKCNFWRK